MRKNRIEFDFSKLLGLITEKYRTRAAFAAAVGMSDSVVSSRVNNGTPFNPDEIYRICLPDCLDIPPTEIGTYFFTPKVR